MKSIVVGSYFYMMASPFQVGPNNPGLGGGNSNIFVTFIPKMGEIIQFDLRVFFNGVGSTTIWENIFWSFSQASNMKIQATPWEKMEGVFEAVKLYPMTDPCMVYLPSFATDLIYHTWIIHGS